LHCTVSRDLGSPLLQVAVGVDPESAARLTLAQFKAMDEQFFLLLLESEATLSAIPNLLPADVAERRKGLSAIRNVLSASGKIEGETAEWMKRSCRCSGSIRRSLRE